MSYAPVNFGGPGGGGQQYSQDQRIRMQMQQQQQMQNQAYSQSQNPYGQRPPVHYQHQTQQRAPQYQQQQMQQRAPQYQHQMQQRIPQQRVPQQYQQNGYSQPPPSHAYQAQNSQDSLLQQERMKHLQKMEEERAKQMQEQASQLKSQQPGYGYAQMHQQQQYAQPQTMYNPNVVQHQNAQQLENQRLQRQKEEMRMMKRLKKQLLKPHILFYSQTCEHCAEFFDRIQESERYRSVFRYFSVDVRPQTGKKPLLPSFIRDVPTIVIGVDIYRGEDSFNWLSTAVESEENGTMNETNMEPSGHVPTELMGWIDKYEFLDSKQASQSFTVRVDKTKKPILPKIETPVETGGNIQRIESFESQRQSDHNQNQYQDKSQNMSIPSISARNTKHVDADFQRLRASLGNSFVGQERKDNIDFTFAYQKKFKEKTKKEIQSDMEKMINTRAKDDSKMQSKLSKLVRR